MADGHFISMTHKITDVIDKNAINLSFRLHDPNSNSMIYLEFSSSEEAMTWLDETKQKLKEGGIDANQPITTD